MSLKTNMNHLIFLVVILTCSNMCDLTWNELDYMFYIKKLFIIAYLNKFVLILSMKKPQLIMKIIVFVHYYHVGLRETGFPKHKNNWTIQKKN